MNISYEESGVGSFLSRLKKDITKSVDESDVSAFFLQLKEDVTESIDKSDVDSFFSQLKETITEPVLKSTCDNLLQDLNVLQRRVINLTDLAYGSKTQVKTEAVSVCIECEHLEAVEKSKNIFKDIANTINMSQCQDILPGKERIVVAGTEEVMNDFYRVKRELDGSYSIPLNIEFFADVDYDGKVPKENVPSYYMQKAQFCLEKAGSKLLGPNGEKLNILISTPSVSKDQACKPVLTTIGIRSQEFRSNSGEYSADIDCPTITHEILHLLGLPDEYQETLSGYYVNPNTGEVENDQGRANPEAYNFVHKHDCRIVKENSVMASQQEKWDNVFKSKMDDSLLNPEQFSSIMYGSCPEKNQVFNECAKLSKKSSVDNPECLEQKKKCLEKYKKEKNQNVTSLFNSSFRRDGSVSF